ncbi:peptide deformylase [Austwickia chelonae]|uniref:Peptide deformylase n=1 Tax=Austwickia chelonae NBRC 105200 TaxID=1184607 RepID=K6VRJ8_9MICO|nr:peptide deformylase [Austwickia chelonae]GAB79389.1 peptide deformylase [Austwickia chelonae NBRC 105200]
MTSVFGAFGSVQRGRQGPAAPADRRPRIDGIPVDRLPEVLAETRRGQRLRVTTVGEDVLARPCREVTEFGGSTLRSLIDDMYATMACCHGVGLAANQVGVDLRLFVYDCDDAYGVRHVGHVINPVVEVRDRRPADREADEEGCLSVPGPSAAVNRPATAVVHGVDMYGKPVVVNGTGMLARCLQHECDHLDGKLYIDHLNGRERRRVLKAMESEKQDTWDRWEERALALGKSPAAELSPEPPDVEDCVAASG